MYAVARKMSQDPTIDFSSDDAAAYAAFVNLWVKKTYPLFDWPEWTFISQFTPSAHYVSYTDVAGPIGRVMRVYLRDPQVDRGVLTTPFKMEESGVFCGFEHGTNVWIKFIKPAPQYTSTPWSASVAYAVGNLVYDPASGNCYISIQAGTNHLVTDAAFWTLVAFPEQIQLPVVRGVYSEALREEGQNEKADEEEKAAFLEAQGLANAQVHDAYDAVTDQTVTAPRYSAVGGVRAAPAQ
jgi:hypothetical protein